MAVVLAPLGAGYAHMNHGNSETENSVSIDMGQGSSHHHAAEPDHGDSGDSDVDCCSLKSGACAQVATIWSGGWNFHPVNFEAVNLSFDQESLVGRPAKVLKQPPRHI